MSSLKEEDVFWAINNKDWAMNNQEKWAFGIAEKYYKKKEKEKVEKLKKSSIDGGDIGINNKGEFLLNDKKYVGIKDDFILIRKDKWKEVLKNEY